MIRVLAAVERNINIEAADRKTGNIWRNAYEEAVIYI